jgi:hypothetical protein
MMVTLYRREPNGTTHYATITDRQGNLFGYPTLTVTSGRDFFLVNERHFTYETDAELQRALRGMIDRRLKKGFEVLYSYFREDRFSGLQKKLEHSGSEDQRAVDSL